MSDDPIPGLPGRFLRKLGDMMSAQAEAAFWKKDTGAVREAMHHYDAAQERPARRLMEDVQRSDNGGPGWRNDQPQTARRSIWADDMREAENAALRAAAVENTHDHGRDR